VQGIDIAGVIWLPVKVISGNQKGNMNVSD
jgi:hypothetical protein